MTEEIVKRKGKKFVHVKRSKHMQSENVHIYHIVLLSTPRTLAGLLFFLCAICVRTKWLFQFLQPMRLPYPLLPIVRFHSRTYLVFMLLLKKISVCDLLLTAYAIQRAGVCASADVTITARKLDCTFIFFGCNFHPYVRLKPKYLLRHFHSNNTQQDPFRGRHSYALVSIKTLK